jgi:hypothetical protein
VSLLSLRDSDLIRAAIEIGVREAFAHCSPDILKSFAAAVGGEIPPPDQPLKLSPAAERGAFDTLKQQERDPHLRVRLPVAMQMIGVGKSKLFELADAGLIDSVMSGGARLYIANSLYRLLIRDIVLSHPYGAPAKKAPLPWASFKTHDRGDRIDGRKLRRVRTQAELDALARSNLRRKEEAATRRAREAEQRREAGKVAQV